MIQYLLQQLNLNDSRIQSIEAFAESFRLRPYVAIIKENPNIIHDLQKLYPNRIKDNWDCIVELYRYNIKLSKAIYPFLSILENIIKVRVSNYLRDRYGEDFYYDENLFFTKLNLDKFDIEIFYKYFNHKINKFVREELIELYKQNNPLMSKEKIKGKISQIKRAVSILSDAQEYRFKNTNSNFIGFVESKPTLNYWITLLEITDLYISENHNYLELDKIFPNIQDNSIRTLKTVSQKLDDIRLLRNDISHYGKIIYRDLSKNLDLYDIYSNILYMFKILGCKNIEYIIGDIACCEEGNFEKLYHRLEFLHNAYRNKKAN